MRKVIMTWDGRNLQWQKMFQGLRFRVTCSELGLPRELWTKNDSYLKANEWWEAMRGTLTPLAKAGGQEQLDEAKTAGLAAIELKTLLARLELLPKTIDEPTMARMNELASIINPASTGDNSIGKALDDFLAIVGKNQKPKSFRETKDFVDDLRDFGTVLNERMGCQQIHEEKVSKVWMHLDSLSLASITKKKRWTIFRRFVRYLFEQGKIDLPRNLGSKLFAFKTTPSAIKTYSPEVVRAELASLPERLRVWALLGLNCGMTNADIGNLHKSQVVNGYLTRKRVKTERTDNVPTVTYLLWAETIELLDKFKSAASSEFWFVSQDGTPLVSSRIEDGKAKIKDLVALRWKRYGKATIMLKQYRSIAATALESHAEYGRFVSYFLGHSPKSIKDKHYAAPSQKLFDTALLWLKKELLG